MSTETLQRLRAKVVELDLAVLRAVDARIRTAGQIARLKQELDLPARDLVVETLLLTAMLDAERETLSEQGVRELVDYLLTLTRLELERAAGRLG